MAGTNGRASQRNRPPRRRSRRCICRSGRKPGADVIARLLIELPIPAGDLIEKGKVPDNCYMAIRYANGHPEGAPFEHYGPLQSEQAITYAGAGEILEFVRARLA